MKRILMLAATALVVLSGCAGGRQETADRSCGGVAGLQCGAGQYCKIPAGMCRTADALGYCAPKPQVCSQQYNPVCACNGETYANACTAAAAGVSVAYKGECEPSGS